MSDRTFDSDFVRILGAAISDGLKEGTIVPPHVEFDVPSEPILCQLCRAPVDPDDCFDDGWGESYWHHECAERTVDVDTTAVADDARERVSAIREAWR